MSTTDNLFNADGSRFNAADDTLELTDYTIAAARAVTIEQALLRGFLTPTDFDGVPSSFSPHAAWGAIHCSKIPSPAPWAGVRVGQTALTDGTEKRRATKKTKMTHASMNELRRQLGKGSGSPRRWM